jgi:alpha-glucosidase
MFRQIILLSFTAAALGGFSSADVAHAAREEIVESPDKSIVATVGVDGGGQLRYSITRNGRPIVEPSVIHVRLANVGDIASNAAVQNVEHDGVDETSELDWGKSRSIRDHHRAGRFRFKSQAGVEWDFEVRVFNNGVALRYGIPKQPNIEDVVIEDENIEFRLAEDPAVLYTTCENFTTSHEAIYERKSLSALPAKKLFDKPLTIDWGDGRAAAITEARLRDFAGMYLERPDAGSSTLRTRLSPLPGKKDVVVRSQAPCWSPWRVVLLADKPGQLIENDVLLCLNDAPERDFDWVVPGKTSFHWWNGTVEHGPPSTPESNFAIHKRYIDFCAKHNIEYHSVISVSGNRPWYVQEKSGFAAPHPDTDILKARPDIDLPRILDYARSKDVGIRFWVHWKPLSEHLEEAFAQYERWGIRGLMVDFMDRDDQEMVKWQEECLRAAARHKLHIQFHGSHKPTGEQRTFPNLVNREGVLNLEYLKWTDLCTPAHSVNVAYTRMLAGPVDYHLGGFRAKSRETFVSRDLEPFVMGTRCNQLALYVVFDNPMPMVADDPSAYEGQPGFEFIVDVPTTWDETRFIEGDMGEYVVLARRKGNAWYLAGITNWTPRKLSIPLDFLGEARFQATVFSDDASADSDPNTVNEHVKEVSARDKLDFELATGGGVAVILKPVDRQR